MNQRTALYRHFDVDGNLLYVGISLSVAARTAQHRQLAHWFERIAIIKVEHFPDRQTALAAETKAIKEEHPMFNLTFWLPLNAWQLYEAGKLSLPHFRKRGPSYYYDAGGSPRCWINLGTGIITALSAYEQIIRGFYKPDKTPTRRYSQAAD